MKRKKPTTYKADPVVSCRIEGDEDAILFNPDTDKTCVINSTGIAIWHFLKTARSEDEIRLYLADQYDEAPDSEDLLEDIRAFLQRLGNDYLIRDPRDGT